jgi:3-oxoacyl-[acyl-carrier-protein] synthase-3
MVQASAEVMARRGLTARDIDLVVPHQANLRIIEAVAKKLEMPMERVIVNVERYGNMSAGTVPIALVEALEAGRLKPGGLLLMPAFGAGLTWCAHLVRWGERVTPLMQVADELPPPQQSALELVQDLMRRRELAPA